MYQSWTKGLVWQVVGVVCYLAGALTFLAVVFGTTDASASEFPAGLFAGESLVWLTVSALLFGLGGVASWKGRAVRPEDDSPLPSQFRSGPGSGAKRGDARREAAPENPMGSSDSGADEATGMRCPHCGTRNDPGFTFCRDCSRKITD